MKLILTLLSVFILKSSIFGQVCDTIEGKEINCVDSYGLKQGYWVERIKYLNYSVNDDSGYHEFSNYLVSSEGTYKNSNKTGTWKYYRNLHNGKQGGIEKLITYLDNSNIIEENYLYKYKIETNSDTTYIRGMVFLSCDTVSVIGDGIHFAFRTSQGLQFFESTNEKFEFQFSRLIMGTFDQEIKMINNAR